MKGDANCVLWLHANLWSLMNGHSIALDQNQCGRCFFQFANEQTLASHRPDHCANRQKSQLSGYPRDRMPSEGAELEGTMIRFSRHHELMEKWALTFVSHAATPSDSGLGFDWGEIKCWVLLNYKLDDLKNGLAQYIARADGPIPCPQCLRLYCAEDRKKDCNKMASRLFWEKARWFVERLFQPVQLELIYGPPFNPVVGGH